MGLKVLFSGDFGVLEAPYFFKSMALRVSDLWFFFIPFGLQESNFSVFIGTEHIKLS